jgi:hypothetical protein
MSTLAMWTVYDNPTDYPGKFVARRFDVDGSGPKPTASIIIMEDLEALRDVLQFELGLVKLMRNEGDEPQIVETWL